jgi:hypothetical protein
VILHLLMNLGFAGGGGVTAPATLGDLTTLFVHYVEDLRDANPLKVDSDTLIAKDRATVVAGGNSPDDINTAYAFYLS